MTMKNVEELIVEMGEDISGSLADLCAESSAAWLTLETSLCDMQAQIQNLETTFEARVIEAVKRAQRDHRL